MSRRLWYRRRQALWRRKESCGVASIRAWRATKRHNVGRHGGMEMYHASETSMLTTPFVRFVTGRCGADYGRKRRRRRQYGWYQSFTLSLGYTIETSF